MITDDIDRHVTEAADICDQFRDANLLPAKWAVGLDPWGVAALHDELGRRDYSEEMITAVAQGGYLSGAIKGLERRLINRTFAHGGQPLLDWSVSNAKAETKGSNLYITKQAAGTAKIDPLIALFNASMLMDRNPVPAMTVWRVSEAYAV